MPSDRVKKILSLAAKKLNELDDHYKTNTECLPSTSRDINQILSESNSDPFDSDDSVNDQTYVLSDNAESSTSTENADGFTETEEDSSYVTSITRSDIESGSATPSGAPGIVNWTQIFTNTCNFIPYPEESVVDSNINSVTIKRPIDIFNYFLTDEILELIVRETNTHASQQIINILHGKSRAKSWSDTNTN